MGARMDEDLEVTVARLVAHLWFACWLEAGRDRVICLSKGEAPDNRSALYVWARGELQYCHGMTMAEIRTRLEKRLENRLMLWEQHPERNRTVG